MHLIIRSQYAMEGLTPLYWGLVNLLSPVF